MPEQNGEAPRRPQICTDSYDNPFTAVQRFVDEHMSSMLQSVLGLPSMLHPPRTWSREETYDGRSDQWRNRDEDSGSGERSRIGEHAVAEFLYLSPYSPFNIENDPDLKVFGSLWRQAFGDLLDATEGQKMMSTLRSLDKREWIDYYVPRWGKSVEQRMAGQGMVPSLFGSVDAAAGNLLERMEAFHKSFSEEFRASERTSEERTNGNPASEQGEGPDTELDIYERILGLENDGPSESHQGSSSSDAPPNPSPAAGARQDQPSSLVSTLTTTERVTMPDGSIRTKRVLRKKFADGSEESNESEEIRAPSGNSNTALTNVSRQQRTGISGSEEKTQPEPEKKSGWFWS